ncbi:hypothetical protein [Brevundimonas sp.]|uniref:hypothetical protein n=1 Tax=Brevundimonas sp. TaxID=1871086 RepID=UPI00391BE970
MRRQRGHEQPLLVAAGGGGGGATRYCCGHGGVGGGEAGAEGCSPVASPQLAEFAGSHGEHGDARDETGLPAHHEVRRRAPRS